MEALIARQAAILSEIKRVHTNFLKDSASRKTKEYVSCSGDCLRQLVIQDWYEGTRSEILSWEMKLHASPAPAQPEGTTSAGTESSKRVTIQFDSNRFERPKVMDTLTELQQLQNANFRAFKSRAAASSNSSTLIGGGGGSAGVSPPHSGRMPGGSELRGGGGKDRPQPDRGGRGAMVVATGAPRPRSRSRGRLEWAAPGVCVQALQHLLPRTPPWRGRWPSARPSSPPDIGHIGGPLRRRSAPGGGGSGCRPAYSPCRLSAERQSPKTTSRTWRRSPGGRAQRHTRFTHLRERFTEA
ncbi:hypothetical protein ACJJTC_008643 [Scirpophaga incertulas]